MDIQNSLHILADILEDFQCILVDKYRQADCWQRDIDYLVHREMDCRALLGLILISKDSKTRFNFFFKFEYLYLNSDLKICNYPFEQWDCNIWKDHQWIQIYKYMLVNGWSLDKLHFDHKFLDKDLDI